MVEIFNRVLFSLVISNSGQQVSQYHCQIMFLWGFCLLSVMFGRVLKVYLFPSDKAYNRVQEEPVYVELPDVCPSNTQFTGKSDRTRLNNSPCPLLRSFVGNELSFIRLSVLPSVRWSNLPSFVHSFILSASLNDHWLLVCKLLGLF